MSRRTQETVAPGQSFATTHWSIVIAAGDTPNPQSSAALTALCQTYWFPAYVFLRRKGLDSHEAQDLTQSFFADFLARNSVARANRSIGRFRSFLVGSLENFVHKEWRSRSAQKRGGGQVPVPLDTVNAEERFCAEPAGTETPAGAYDREWARALLHKALEALHREWEQSGRGALSLEFQAHLWGDPEAVPYSELSRRFDLTPVNLRVTFHRFRQRYRELLRQAVAETVASEAEVDDELRLLMAVVSQ